MHMEQINTSELHARQLRSRNMQTFTKHLDLLTYVAIKSKNSMFHLLSDRDMVGGYGTEGWGKPG